MRAETAPKIVEKRTVTRYYATRKLRMPPSKLFDHDTYTQRRTFAVKRAAYEWVARASIFKRRVEQGCQSKPHQDDGACTCRYCDESKFRQMMERLARLLMHYDTKGLTR